MRRPLRAVRPPTVDPNANALRALALALLPHLRDLVSIERQDDDLVDVLRAVPGPRRTVLRACRSGHIAGAVRVGRRWLAPRAAIDAWLRAMGPRPVPTTDADDELDELRESLTRGARRK